MNNFNKCFNSLNTIPSIFGAGECEGDPRNNSQCYSCPYYSDDRKKESFEPLRPIKDGYLSEDLIRNAAEYWKDSMSLAVMEECGELMQAYSKIERKGISDDTLQNLKEEIRDVSIVLAMLMEVFNISSDEMFSMIQTKLSKEK